MSLINFDCKGVYFSLNAKIFSKNLLLYKSVWNIPMSDTRNNILDSEHEYAVFLLEYEFHEISRIKISSSVYNTIGDSRPERQRGKISAEGAT